jgi:16S rRNA (cytidine1402-2'-O)-methyltransferase
VEKIITGALYIVSTPIGHLGDMTFRAIHILKNVDLILCEDTRVTRKLLDYYDIKTTYHSFHQHNEHSKALDVVNDLKKGQAIALVSDAGTPLISDPGYPLIKMCIDENIRVIPIGGASALLNALVASGMISHPFYFEGFLPKKKQAKTKVLEKIKNLEATLIFYESPNRVLESIQSMLEVFGDRKLTLARELTKKHETFTYSTLKNIEEIDIHIKGEYVIIVEGLIHEVIALGETTISMFETYLEKGMSEKEAMKKVAEISGVSKREVYQLIKVKKGNIDE